MTELTGIDRLPKPTKENWAVQIDWIFDRVADLSDWAEATKNTCRCIKYNYIAFVVESVGRQPTILADFWNEMSLLEWRDYLLKKVSQKILGGKTANTYHNTVSKVMRQAYFWGVTSIRPIHINLPREISQHRSSDYTKAFDMEYLVSINVVLRRYLNMAIKYSEPYIRKNVGRNPRMNSEQRCELVRNRKLKIPDDKGWTVWENVIWFFENVFNSQVPHPQDFSDPPYDNFTSQVTKLYGTLENVWQRIGVHSWHLRQDIIYALTFCLANETGLNLSSLKSLKVDCFHSEHELSRQPYIKYYKPRSGGYKELHLNIFNDEDRVRSASSDDISNDSYLWLNDKRASRVKKIIDLILSLTADIRLRPDFPTEYKNKLIVWLQSRSPGIKKRYGSLSDEEGPNRLRCFVCEKLKKQIMAEAISRMHSQVPEKLWEKQEKIIRKDVMSQSFTIARFRATVASELIKAGASLEEIQAFLGHAHISTTIMYIRQHDFDLSFYRDMNKFLKTIKNNTVKYSDQGQNVSVKGAPKGTTGAKYEIALGFCLDPYSPSEKVKKSTGWLKNQPCRMWNQCLFCDKILITSNSLAPLFAYRAKLYLSLTSHFTVSSHKALPMIRAISIIDEIECSKIFSDEEIARARLSAESIDYEILDMMLIHSFNNNSSDKQDIAAFR